MSKISSFLWRSEKGRLGPGDHAIGLALCVTYVALLIATSFDLGFSRDEGFYFSASSTYAQWFKLFFENRDAATDRAVVDQYWQANHEHPSLMKGLFALSYMFFYEKNKIFPEASLAFRFPA